MQTSKIHKICTTIHRKTRILHFKICYLYPNDATIRKCLSILAVGVKTKYQPLKETFKMARHPLYSKTPDKGNSWLIKCRIMQNLVYRNLSWKTVQKYCPNAQPILLWIRHQVTYILQNLVYYYAHPIAQNQNHILVYFSLYNHMSCHRSILIVRWWSSIM